MVVRVITYSQPQASLLSLEEEIHIDVAIPQTYGMFEGDVIAIYASVTAIHLVGAMKIDPVLVSDLFDSLGCADMRGVPLGRIVAFFKVKDRDKGYWNLQRIARLDPGWEIVGYEGADPEESKRAFWYVDVPEAKEMELLMEALF